MSAMNFFPSSFVFVNLSVYVVVTMNSGQVRGILFGSGGGDRSILMVIRQDLTHIADDFEDKVK